jgi:ribonucleotide monophosphatase NagD (HAD superfamily)
MDAYRTLHAFPDVKPGLEQLKAKGLGLAILSNGAPEMLQSATASAGIRDLLDEIISVDEVKVFKPSPRVYQLASTRLGVATEDIGFVSSNGWDVAGASSAGLTAFWIQRGAAEPPEDLGYHATRVVHAITDLVEPEGPPLRCGSSPEPRIPNPGRASNIIRFFHSPVRRFPCLSPRPHRSARIFNRNIRICSAPRRLAAGR